MKRREETSGQFPKMNGKRPEGRWKSQKEHDSMKDEIGMGKMERFLQELLPRTEETAVKGEKDKIRKLREGTVKKKERETEKESDKKKGNERDKGRDRREEELGTR